MVLIRLVPDEEIEAAHARHYGARAAVAPPAVRNAEALAMLGEPRPLRFRGSYYHVPNLTFRAGLQLTVCAQVLSLPHARIKHKAALETTRRILREVARKNGRRPLLNPFRTLTDPDEACGVIDGLLYLPDEYPHPVSRKNQPIIDVLDGFFEFTRMFPALIGPDGLPVSWAHYHYGMRHMTRAIARETLRIAQASRISQCPADVWAKFSREQTRAAGWN